MPFFDEAVDCAYFNPNLICPAASCKKNISKSQAVVVCCFCCKLYHPSCKGIIGAVKIKKAGESNWVCSPDCSKLITPKSGVSVFEPPLTPTSTLATSESVSNCEINFSAFIKRFDAQFTEVKSMIADIKNSQDFICNEFDIIKNQIKNILENNLILSKKYEVLNEAYQRQHERINNLEFNLDGFHQRDLNPSLIIAGLPDKISAPNTIIRNLLSVLKCEESIADVISSDYMASGKTSKQNASNLEDNKIIIKFKNSSAKNKVVQQKKLLKPILLASDIGLQQNQNKQLYFRDYLTAFRQTLFRDARLIKKSINYKYLWVRDGNIYFRESDGSKIILVKSRADLNRLSGTETQIRI